ncbi:MAG: hypothetical protein ABI784_05450 [Ginsengibacter sp.]
MLYILFLFYFLLLSWSIRKGKFFLESDLSVNALNLLFLVHVITGILGTWFFLNYSAVFDSNVFQQQGIVEYNLLIHHPWEYLTNLFQDNYRSNYSGLMEVKNSYWNDTRSNVLFKMLSVFNIFSFKSFYINTLFFVYFIFWGNIALYKVFRIIFPNCRLTNILTIFLLPSALLFTSLIHRDGLILLSLSFISYHIFFGLKEKHFGFRRILILIFYLFTIFILRNYIVILLFPPLIAWIWAYYKPKYSLIIFIGVMVISSVAFFCIRYFIPALDFPELVASRQRSFIALSGNSALNINPLYASFRSFMNNMPQAFNHTLLRPYLSEIRSIEYLPFALELIIYELLLMIYIFFRQKKVQYDPFIYFCIFFSLAMMLAIGYTVPFIGAFVRYRSIYFIFLICPLTALIDWNKFFTTIHIIKKNI